MDTGPQTQTRTQTHIRQMINTKTQLAISGYFFLSSNTYRAHAHHNTYTPTPQAQTHTTLTYILATFCTALHPQNKFLFACNNLNKLSVYDVSNPTLPKLNATLPTFSKRTIDTHTTRTSLSLHLVHTITSALFLYTVVRFETQLSYST